MHVLEKALEKDLRVKFPSRDEAHNFRFRIYKARAIDRDDSKGVYNPDHPAYGTSQYDALNIQVMDENEFWYVYVTTRPQSLAIEEI